MSTPRSIPTLIVLLMLPVLLAAPGAEARKSDRDQPMNVVSDDSDGGFGDDDSMVLRGNVRITQGTLSIGAERATVERRAGDIVRIVLEGAPVTMDQVTDRGEPMKATAARITYTPTEEIVLLSGNARVEQPRGAMTSETIRYNLDTGRVNSGGDGNRVQMTIQPKAGAAAN